MLMSPLMISKIKNNKISQPPDTTFNEQIKVLILQPPDATFYHFNITEDYAFCISCTLYYNIRLIDFSNKEVVSD